MWRNANSLKILHIAQSNPELAVTAAMFMTFPMMISSTCGAPWERKVIFLTLLHKDNFAQRQYLQYGKRRPKEKLCMGNSYTQIRFLNVRCKFWHCCDVTDSCWRSVAVPDCRTFVCVKYLLCPLREQCLLEMLRCTIVKSFFNNKLWLKEGFINQQDSQVVRLQ